MSRDAEQEHYLVSLYAYLYRVVVGVAFLAAFAFAMVGLSWFVGRYQYAARVLLVTLAVLLMAYGVGYAVEQELE